MDLLPLLPKFVIDVATKLLSRSREQSTRARFGDLLLQISECVAAISDAVRAGTNPADRCAQLDVYLKNLEAFATKYVEPDVYKKIAARLYWVGDAPGGYLTDLKPTLLSDARRRWTQARRYQTSVEIHEVAGMLRAVADLVRAAG